MKNEIYLYSKCGCYYFYLLVQEGCSWVVEWGDGSRDRYVETGEWELEGHNFRDSGIYCIHNICRG